MGDPLKEQDQIVPALRQVADAAGPYFAALPQRLVYDRTAEPLLDRLGGPLPEEGRGTAAHLTAGIEHADSLAADAHKWLNVPYESGFVLVRDPARLGPAFGMPGAPPPPTSTCSSRWSANSAPPCAKARRAAAPVPRWG